MGFYQYKHADLHMSTRMYDIPISDFLRTSVVRRTKAYVNSCRTAAATSLFPAFGTVWTVHKTINSPHTKMYSLTKREVWVNPCLINSVCRAHLYNTTKVKTKAPLRVGKVKKRKQHLWVSCQRPEEEKRVKKPANILNKEPSMNKSTTTREQVCLSSRDRAKTWWYHKTSRDHPVSAVLSKP